MNVSSYLKSNLRWLIDLLQINKTVVYGVLTNVWRILAGVVTMVLIVNYFSPTLQGFYFTFNSITALQVLVEGGLGTVIISFASHEWSKLHLDSVGQIAGDLKALSRLVSLARIVFLWFFIGGVIIIIGLSIVGYLFFSQSKDAFGIIWSAPWFLLCVLTGINMWFTPTFSLLEGCNQLKQIYAFRLYSSIITSLFSWSAILLNVGLWVAVIILAISIICQLIFLISRYRSFFGPMISYVITDRINWRKDLWPMQWRIALSFISGYFMFSFFTPLLFHYHGAVVAGQMGLTLGLFNSIGNIANMWVVAKRPTMGILIANKDYKSLDRLFARTATISIGLFIFGSLFLWVLVYTIYNFDLSIAARVLPPLPSGLFLIGMASTYFTSPFSYYLRAHNREPYLLLSIFSAILQGLLAWQLGKTYGATGVASGFLVVGLFFSLPYALIVWHKFRTKWQIENL